MIFKKKKYHTVKNSKLAINLPMETMQHEINSSIKGRGTLLQIYPIYPVAKLGSVGMPVLWRRTYAAFERLFGKKGEKVRRNEPAH
jgi:hypothetical protein